MRERKQKLCKEIFYRLSQLIDLMEASPLIEEFYFQPRVSKEEMDLMLELEKSLSQARFRAAALYTALGGTEIKILP